MKLLKITYILCFVSFSSLIAQEVELQKSVIYNPGEDTTAGPNFPSFLNEIGIGIYPGLSFLDGENTLYNILPKRSEMGRSLSPAFCFSLQRLVYRDISVRLQYNRSLLKGSRVLKNEPTVNFETKQSTITAQAVINIFDYLINDNARAINVNVHIGGGVMAFRSFAYQLKSQQVISQIGYEYTPDSTSSNFKDVLKKKNNIWIPVLNLGASLEYTLTKYIDVTLYYELNMTPYDKLDGKKNGYGKNDRVSFIGVGVTAFFNREKFKAVKKYFLL